MKHGELLPAVGGPADGGTIKVNRLLQGTVPNDPIACFLYQKRYLYVCDQKRRAFIYYGQRRPGSGEQDRPGGGGS